MFPQPTRRAFIAGSSVAALSAPRISGTTNDIRFGGPVFLKSDDPIDLAAKHRRLGYSAAYCPEVKISQTDRIEAIRKAFDEAKVVIAEVGAWKNMLDPDPIKRRENLAYVIERCALAEIVGAPGSPNSLNGVAQL
jgi:hypothetical protein